MAACPYYVAVDGDDEVVDVDGEVGVDAFAEVDPHGDGRHDHGGVPHTPVGMVFPPEIEEANGEA